MLSKTVPAWPYHSRLVFFEVFVENELAQTGADAFDVGDMIGQFFDRLHLFLEIVGLQEIAELRIVAFSCELVNVQKTLVDLLLELQSGGESRGKGAPFIIRWLGDVFENDASASHVLVFHELHGVLSLFFGCFEEVLLDVLESNVIAVEIERHGQVHVRCGELHVDLPVDGSFAIGVEVLSGTRHFSKSFQAGF